MRYEMDKPFFFSISHRFSWSGLVLRQVRAFLDPGTQSASPLDN
jgi:hypothetical protein